MTYIVEKPAANNTGIEQTLFTIEFYYKHKIEHHEFKLCERVIMKNHFPQKVYTVFALKICISETPSGELLFPPYWKYEVTDAEKNSFWKEETALIRYKDTPSPSLKTNDCVVSTQTVEAFPTEVLELDRDGYLIEEAEPSGYSSTNFTTHPDEPF